MALNLFDPRQRADLRRVSSGNWAQKIAGGLGQFASGIGINRDFGVSEMFGTPTAQAAEPASSFGPNNPANFPPTPNEWQRLGYSSEEEYQQYLANGYTGPKSEYTNWLKDLVSKSTTSGGGGTEVTPYMVRFGDRYYDLNNPTDRSAYLSDTSSQIENQYTQYETTEQNALRDAIANAERTYGQQTADVNLDLKNLGTNRTDYLTGYDQSLADLGEGYRAGGAKRQNYFSGLGSRAYQSAQGSSQQYADTKYQQAQDAKSQEKARNLERFGQAEQGLQRDLSNLEYGYNNYLEQSRQSLADRLSGARNSANEQKLGIENEVLNNLISTGAVKNIGDITGQSGFGQFSGARSAYQAPTAEQIDLSGYTKYTNFDQLAQSPVAQYFKRYTPTTQSSTADPLTQFLGYTPDESTKNYLRAYLSGKA